MYDLLNALLNIVYTYFIENVCICVYQRNYTFLLSVSGIGTGAIPASQNEFGSIHSFSIWWDHLRSIGVNPSLNVLLKLVNASSPGFPMLGDILLLFSLIVWCWTSWDAHMLCSCLSRNLPISFGDCYYFFFVIQIYKLFPKGPLTVTAIYFSAFVFIFNFISWDLLFSYLVWLGVSQFCLFSLKKQSRFPGSFYSFIFQFHYCPSYLYFFCIVHLGLLILSLIPWSTRLFMRDPSNFL